MPGYFAGDNVAFLWNTWWFRESFARHSLGLWTDRLFAPWGTSLALHTHTLLEVAAGLLLFPAASPARAENLVIIGGIAANALAAYALAYHYTKRSSASLVAGLMFGWSAFVALRLAGHFNLVHAWVLPLAALCGLRFLDRPSYRRAIGVAVAVAAAAYTDYYYLVYSTSLIGVLAVARGRRLLVTRRPGSGTLAGALLAVAVAMAFTAVVVEWSGGWTLQIGPMPIPMHRLHTPVLAASLLGGLAWLVRYQVSSARIDSSPPAPTGRQWLAAVGVSLLLVSPLAIAIVQMVVTDGYPSPRILWRTSAPGIDLATIVEGPPRHLIFGEMVTLAYKTADISIQEQSGWVGIVALVGTLIALVKYRREAEVRLWLVVALVYFTIALGPFVRVGGFDTGVPTPFAVLRYVPILSNARIPGRAIVVVQLAVAVLTAMVVARRTRGWGDCTVWLLVLVAEAVPRPAPLYSLPAPDQVDGVLRTSLVQGAVLELPTGIRDGFGMTGGLDHRALVHQIAHGRALVGGFVARLSPSLRARCLQTPLLVHAFDVSRRDHPRDHTFAASDAAALGIAFLVVNRDAIDDLPGIGRPALEAGGFRFVTADGDRELYAVAPGGP